MLYAALTTALDGGIGVARDALEAENLRENTLVFFLSDNGGRKDGADNRPLRGFKGMLHEGGIRAPFAVSWPARLAARQRYDQPVSALDILPAALAAAGAVRTSARSLDGVNLLPYLGGRARSAPHGALFWRAAGGRGYAVRRGRCKPVKDIPTERPQLFDLGRDIRGSRGLAPREPKLTTALAALYENWNAGLEKPRWTENHAANIEGDYRALREARSKALPPGK